MSDALQKEVLCFNVSKMECLVSNNKYWLAYMKLGTLINKVKVILKFYLLHHI